MIVKRFQSTRPIRGATTQTGCPILSRGISIHAPHTGRDVMNHVAILPTTVPFQSTRPIRGATLIIPRVLFPVKGISIHAPHTGRDKSKIKNRRIY